MSTITQTGPFKSTSYGTGMDSRPAGLGAIVRQAFHGLLAWQNQRRAIRELHTLNEHELRDIGITRSDIEAAVRGELSRGRNRF